MKTETAFLFELGVEELPPKYVIAYVKHFQNILFESFRKNALPFKESDCELFATPRRLAILLKMDEHNASQQLIADPAKGQTLENGILWQKQMGPKAKSLDDKAVQGFARSCGVSVDQLSQDDNGRVYCAIEIKPQLSIALLPGIIETAFATFNKAVSMRFMRWGAGDCVFIRPVRWLVCMHGATVIPMSLLGLESSNLTQGHPFHSEGMIALKEAKDYSNLLEKHYVVASFDKRQALIQGQLKDTAAKIEAKAMIDRDLLEEVTAINEWPTVVLCEFDQKFLSVPQEALIQSMQSHQKSFAVMKMDRLSPHFLTVSNIESKDMKTLIHGNEVVMRARLADASFFFESDRCIKLETFNEKNAQIVFQKQLGSVADKTKRVAALALAIAKQVQADEAIVARAASLANADLNSKMVYEFPELQGIMGKHYAICQGETSMVAEAIEQRYWPRFAEDNLPETIEAACLALADRFDTLVGIFGIGAKPTGSKDPYSLRRAAIGIIRIIREKELSLSLLALLSQAQKCYATHQVKEDTISSVHQYILKRLEDIYLKEYPERPQLIDVLRAALASQSVDLCDLDKRVKALILFIDLPQCASVVQSNKRLKNLLAKVEDPALEVKEDLLETEAEKQLWHCYQSIESHLKIHLDYTDQFDSLSQFEKPLADFFEQVMVMVDNHAVKNNRIAILKKINDLFMSVADISLLS